MLNIERTFNIEQLFKGVQTIYDYLYELKDEKYMKSKSLVISFVVSIAAFMEILDTTVTNVALTHIAGDLGAGMEESTWILTSYLVTNAIILPVSGWCSEKFGRKRYFIVCIVGFTIASFLCGIATSLPVLVFFRLIQGLEFHIGKSHADSWHPLPFCSDIVRSIL